MSHHHLEAAEAGAAGLSKLTLGGVEMAASLPTVKFGFTS